MAQITAEDKIKVNELRSHVSDLLTPLYDTDFNLLRWLQFYNYDTSLVIPKLRHHLRFRRSCWQIDNLPPERNWIQKTCYEWGLVGESGMDDNSLIYISQLGREDSYGFTKTFNPIQLLHSVLMDQERIFRALMELEAKTGKQASISFIMDLDGLKLNFQVIELVRKQMKSLNVVPEHYVEVIKKIIVVNAPTFVYYLYSLLKPFLPETTRKNVVILGPNWKEDILRYGTPEVLPERWQGSFTGKLAMPTNIPESSYSKVTMADFSNVTSISVSAGKSQFINISIEKENSKLKFGYQTSGDYGVGLFYTENPEETDPVQMEMVFPQFSKLGGPTVIPAIGELVCEKIGCYKLWFSNEDAWWKNLRVEYFIEIE